MSIVNPEREVQDDPQRTVSHLVRLQMAKLKDGEVGFTVMVPSCGGAPIVHVSGVSGVGLCHRERLPPSSWPSPPVSLRRITLAAASSFGALH